jgi:hypothetical protein
MKHDRETVDSIGLNVAPADSDQEVSTRKFD